LFFKDRIHILLIKAIPGAGCSVHDDRNEATENVQNDPARPDMVRDVDDLRFIAGRAELPASRCPAFSCFPPITLRFISFDAEKRQNWCRNAYSTGAAEKEIIIPCVCDMSEIA